MEDQIPNNVFTLEWNERMQSLVKMRDDFKSKRPHVFEDPSVYIALDFLGMPQPSAFGGESMPFRPIYSDNLPPNIKMEFQAILAKYFLK